MGGEKCGEGGGGEDGGVRFDYVMGARGVCGEERVDNAHAETDVEDS